MAQQGSGYDISASVSSAATLGSRAGEGGQIVIGGGSGVSPVAWIVVGVVSLVLGVIWLRKKR